MSTLLHEWTGQDYSLGTDVMLTVESLSKSFGTVKAVDGVSFQAERGRLTAVVGPSGCGKTTLLRLIAGLDAPDCGRITLDGTVLDSDSVHTAPEHRRVAMVFQDASLWPHMTARANVEFVIRRSAVPRRRRRAVAEAWLDRLKVGPLRERLPREISGGEQQRVALARALAVEPAILLLDEPFAGLDPLLRDDLGRVVAGLVADQAMVAVHVSHLLEKPVWAAHSMVVMRGGRVEQAGPPSGIAGNPNSEFVRSFLGHGVTTCTP
ncbi:MAG: ATP-binding cassette domain-containing protein [Planctomycetota bacterium]|nr:ATP-binding cassette domain-containing protein [Planctomycetota bacterium]